MTGRVGSMVAPRSAPPAGAFLSGQAVFHGRELLAELPLVSDLPFSPGLALEVLGVRGLRLLLAWISAPVRSAAEAPGRRRPEAGCAFSLATLLTAPRWPGFGVVENFLAGEGKRDCVSGGGRFESFSF